MPKLGQVYQRLRARAMRLLIHQRVERTTRIRCTSRIEETVEHERRIVVLSATDLHLETCPFCGQALHLSAPASTSPIATRAAHQDCARPSRNEHPRYSQTDSQTEKELP
jgi:hypothetical protein